MIEEITGKDARYGCLSFKLSHHIDDDSMIYLKMDIIVLFVANEMSV